MRGTDIQCVAYFRHMPAGTGKLIPSAILVPKITFLVPKPVQTLTAYGFIIRDFLIYIFKKITIMEVAVIALCVTLCTVFRSKMIPWPD